jgi:hypothetical protein
MRQSLESRNAGKLRRARQLVDNLLTLKREGADGCALAPCP